MTTIALMLSKPLSDPPSAIEDSRRKKAFEAEGCRAERVPTNFDETGDVAAADLPAYVSMKEKAGNRHRGGKSACGRAFQWKPNWLAFTLEYWREALVAIE